MLQGATVFQQCRLVCPAIEPARMNQRLFACLSPVPVGSEAQLYPVLKHNFLELNLLAEVLVDGRHNRYCERLTRSDRLL
jgi:hypothetical protein